MAKQKDTSKGNYILEWERENYFKTLIRLPKQMEPDIRRRAAEEGESLNGYIKGLIAEDLKENG